MPHLTTNNPLAISAIASLVPPATEAQREAPVDEMEAVVPEGEQVIHVDIGTKLLNATAIIVPFLGLIAAVALLWGWAISWLELTMLVVGYVLTAGGVTIGFHRYFTHKSYSCPRWVQWVIGICASASMQGPLNGWVATHRCHHQCSDRPGDPHSPHVDHDDHEIGGGLKGLIKGYWHSHMGWLFEDTTNVVRYIPDLINDPVARPVSKLFGLWVILGLLIPAGIGFAWYGSWKGALLGLLWGGLVRLFVCHHVTWSINSACHLWGARTYKSHDHSRNNMLFGVLALGEGWHNNHHAFPASARHGLEWWQLDLTWLTIKAMEKVGLAWDIKLPKAERLAAKRNAA